MTRDASSPNAAQLPFQEGRNGSAADEVDPDLLSLPDPPKRGRSLTLLALGLTALASLAMVFALRRDAAYSVASSSASDVADLRTADAAALAQLDNRYVSARGMLGAGGAILFERLFASDSFRAMPVAGRPDVWVEVRVPVGKENARWEPPRTFTGHLVRFDAIGPRHRGIADAIERATGAPIPGGSWLLVDGESPAGSRWASALMALFVAFAMWNVVAMFRLVRKVR